MKNKEKAGSKEFPFWIFWVVLISLFSFLPLLIGGYFSMHDDLQVSRLYEMSLCFKDGQFPCRWVPDMGFGYGYPLFNYYPPLPFYIGQIFLFLGFSFINTAKILFILAFVFSGIFGFLLGRELWGKYGGYVVSAFYIFAPYHALDAYVRGALNEFWALVLFPAIFWAVLKLIKTGEKKFVLMLSLFVGFLLMSHNAMAFFFAPAIACWSLFLVWFFKKDCKVLSKVLIGGFWGLGLASFFTLPALLEKGLVHIETMLMGYFNYLAHFATLKQLFFSRFWGYGPSWWGPEDMMAFSIGQAHWIILLVSLVIFGILWKKKREENFKLLLFLTVFFLGYAYLAHSRSTFFWKIFPPLEFVQFPWRFVGISVFFASIASGSLIFLAKTESKKLILAAILILLVAGMNISFFHPERIIKISDSEKIFSEKGWHKLQTDAIFDYLPIDATLPPAEKAPEEPVIVSGEAKVRNFKKGSDWLSFAVDVESEKALVKAPIYYYPNLKLLVDKKLYDFNYDNELALPVFELEKGSHSINLKIENTFIRKVSNLISFFSWLAIVFFIFRMRNEKK